MRLWIPIALLTLGCTSPPGLALRTSRPNPGEGLAINGSGERLYAPIAGGVAEIRVSGAIASTLGVAPASDELASPDDPIRVVDALEGPSWFTLLTGVGASLTKAYYPVPGGERVPTFTEIYPVPGLIAAALTDAGMVALIEDGDDCFLVWWAGLEPYAQQGAPAEACDHPELFEAEPGTEAVFLAGPGAVHRAAPGGDSPWWDLPDPDRIGDALVAHDRRQFTTYFAQTGTSEVVTIDDLGVERVVHESEGTLGTMATLGDYAGLAMTVQLDDGPELQVLDLATDDLFFRGAAPELAPLVASEDGRFLAVDASDQAVLFSVEPPPGPGDTP